MRDKLQQLLAIIDDHKESLPNGDYLRAMNLLRDLHRGSDHRRPWELVEEASRPRVLCFSDLVFRQPLCENEVARRQLETPTATATVVMKRYLYARPTPGRGDSVVAIL
jgi:hypothetical protein